MPWTSVLPAISRLGARGGLVGAQPDLDFLVLEVEAHQVVAVVPVGAVVAGAGGDADVALAGQRPDPELMLVAVQVEVEDALETSRLWA